MKIVSIKLVNFASIYTGMGKTNVEIDFSKAKNSICLLVGKNGSGKTSLLSNLHPFPYVESIDVRNMQDLILEGKDGLKAMTIMDGENRYDIDIHYTLKNDKRKTSCYIRKNGQELNPSGLVRSYYEILKTVFALEPSFLRILRLGPNVSDIITMRATERKEFIKNFLQDIDVYVMLHDIAKDQSVFIKNQIKAVTYNLDKDGAVTIQNMLAKQKQLENEQKLLEDRKSKYVVEIDRLKKCISKEVLSGKEMDDAITVYEDAKAFLDDYDRFNKAGEFSNVGTDYEKAVIEKTKVETELANCHNTIISLSNQASRYTEQIKDIERKIELITQNTDIDKFDVLMQEYQSKINDLNNTTPLIHQTSVYGTILQLLRNCEEIIKRISDVGVFSIYRKLCKYSEENDVLDDMSKALDKKIGTISEKIGMMKASHPSWRVLLGGHIMYVPDGCVLYKNCPYVNAIESLKKDEEKETYDMMQLLFETHMEAKNRIADLKVIQNNVKTINDYNSELYISFGEIFADMLSMKYDHLFKYEETSQELLSKASDYDLYLELSAKMAELKARKQAADEVGGVSLLKSQINELTSLLNETKLDIEYQKNKESKLKYDLEFNTNMYKAVKNVYDIYTEYTSRVEYYTNIRQNYQLAQSSRKLETELNEKLENAKYEYERVCNEIDDIRYELNHIFYAIQTRHNLEKQLKKLNEEYSNIELIREAVSMSKGIPLLYAQIYLKNIQILANEIIHEMFDESISLMDFVITDKEFRMPYMVNGIEIEDVSCSSQGERTTIVLALSFALLQQMMGRYNILLLDEVDSALYKDNRRKFIKIIKDQMERIDCEQAFLITHNALFENYPVDIIQTSDMDEDYNKGNVIWGCNND